MRNLNLLNKYRWRQREVEISGQYGDEGNGCFVMRSPIDGKALRIIASNNMGWDHVSVSKIGVMPKWMEMEFVKHQFFADSEVVMQLHVPAAQHVNMNKFCLHLWRPHNAYIPTPPSWMVGLTKEELAE